MSSRFNWVWEAPPLQESPIKVDVTIKTKINPISFNEDKSVKEYTEENIYVEKKSKWSDYIKSFDIGSPSEQIISHLTKGTPLVTAHTLPYGDYTQANLLKGADIVRQMKASGITLEMIESVLASANDTSNTEEKEGAK